MLKISNIIVQAGGIGSRLETLTLNKPKALVSIKNLPIIFHLFKKFPTANFKIIADYKAGVLEKYLQIFANVKYEIIQPTQKGTISGIHEALQSINNEPFMITWSDLIIDQNLSLPKKRANYIGLSKNFECRWSYLNNKIIKKPSTTNGIAGLFIFTNKNAFREIPKEGAFVSWLATQNIEFDVFSLEETKEIGTLLSYHSNENMVAKYRPFNQIEFHDDYIIKKSIGKEGKEIALNESNWYLFIKKYSYSFIPKIYNTNPLKMERIKGKNIFEYKHFSYIQKKIILADIIDKIKQLHQTEPPIEANDKDCMSSYIDKTFNRLNKVINLIPFANEKFIRINDHYYRNIFFLKEKLIKMIKTFLPPKFYVIHGDITFSNILLKTEEILPIFIDPRGYFGKSKIYGDRDYDWAKMYYSIVGNYDQFNQKKFSLHIQKEQVHLNIESNGWEDMEKEFFSNTHANEQKIKLLHAIIWLSFTTYAWDDYDSICAAFYKGIIELNKVI